MTDKTIPHFTHISLTDAQLAFLTDAAQLALIAVKVPSSAHKSQVMYDAFAAIDSFPADVVFGTCKLLGDLAMSIEADSLEAKDSGFSVTASPVDSLDDIDKLLGDN